MSRTYVSAQLRRQVVDRAGGTCEYCLIHERDAFYGCEVDHVISEKHGGKTAAENLAYSCLLCNRAKGSDIATILDSPETLVRFFNPRTDRWSQHFRLADDAIRILPLTDIGRATVLILGFNDPQRLIERRILRGVGRYPSPEAQRMIEPM